MNPLKIKCGYGPEDIDLESNTQNHRIIISCTTRKGKKKNKEGGIWYYNFGEKKAKEFTLKGYDKDRIRPHGISIVNRKDESFLYVISHEKPDKILKFQIKSDHLVYEKEWSGTFYTFFDHINDLYVTEQEYIYVTNPGGISLFKKGGEVYLLKPKNQFEKIIDGIYFPNGILVKESKLYLAAFRGNALYSFDLDESGSVDRNSKKKLSSLVGGDNITLFKDELIITTHPKILKFIFHAKLNFKSPSAVYSYNLKSDKLQCLYYNSGKDISGASTAIRIGDELYISQIFGNYLLKVPISMNKISNA